MFAYGLAAVAYLVWALRHEPAGRWPAWRRAALVVAAGCLFLLAARPARERPVPAGRAVLVTVGAEAQWVAALGAAAEVFALPGAPTGLGLEMSDLAGLVRRRPDLEHWTIVGRGLEPWQAEILPGEVAFPAPVAPRAGIDRAQWRRRIALGESLEVQGSVTGVAAPATLRLIGPGGVEAEQDLAEEGLFVLRATPRREGRFLYRLELVDGAGWSADEDLAVEVAPRRPPRILWLEGAPGFESRELKRWLRDLGGVLVVRSQVSRGRFRYDALNHPPVDAVRIGPDGLREFDLVVVDGPAWEGLSAPERKALDAAVEGGLGLLLVPELPSLGAAEQPPFELAAVGDLDQLEVEVRGAAGPSLAPLVVSARQFTDRDGQSTLFADGAERALAVARPRGLGRFAATVLEGTHRWVLRGESASHRAYWSALLAAVARPQESTLVSAPVGPLLIDRPHALERLAADHETLLGVGPAGEAWPLAQAQDPLEARRWQARWWPRTVGWHQLVQGEATVWCHVGAADDWPAWQDRQRLEATLARAALGPAAGAESPVARQVREVPRWPWAALLLVAWAALWADAHWRRAPLAR